MFQELEPVARTWLISTAQRIQASSDFKLRGLRWSSLSATVFTEAGQVVDNIPTYGSHPENCGFKLVPKAQKDWTLVSSRVACSRACTGTRLVLYRYKVDGCTGTAIGLVPVQSRRPRNPSLGFAFSWALYRYKGADFVQFELQGAFRDWSLPTSRHSGDSHRDAYSPCGIGRRSGLPWARLIPRPDLFLPSPSPFATAISCRDLRRSPPEISPAIAPAKISGDRRPFSPQHPNTPTFFSQTLLHSISSDRSCQDLGRSSPERSPAIEVDKLRNTSLGLCCVRFSASPLGHIFDHRPRHTFLQHLPIHLKKLNK
uniref:Uncharacterized protein n=1 Tax=Ananas comosus var. bracteatus TaxID=296719 RepID=A0A6V7PH44_ANACO|nr:unnamed protein product [Ananas comosus var. bracteatus]